MKVGTTTFPKSTKRLYTLCGITSLLGFLSLLLATIVSGAEDMGFNYNMGPALLELSSQAPGQSFRYSPIPCAHEAIVPGNIHLRLGSSWSNIFTNGSDYNLDYEILHTRLSVSYGVSDRLQLGAAFEQRNFFGGGMDGLIIEFHDIFRIEQGGRTEVPKNSGRYLFRDALGNVTVDSDNIDSFDNKNIQAEASYVLSPGTRILPAIHLKGTVCRELSTPLKGGGDPLDLSIGIGLSKRWAPKWFSYHNVAYTRFGHNEHPHFTLSENGLSIVNAIVWQRRPRFSYLIQFMYAEGLFRNIPGLSDATHEAHLGFKWQLKSGDLLEFAFIENVITYDNSPDFGIHLAYTYASK